MSKVSVIIPVIRPARAKRCIAAVGANAGVDNYDIVVEEDTDRIGCPLIVKRLIGRSIGEIVCFLGDDCVPQPDFLRNGLAAMSTMSDGWGMVGFNDLHHNGNKLAAHWLADKRLLPLLGGELFHIGYKHTQCDRELLFRCKALGRYIWAQDAVVKHEHPIFGTGEPDADYDRIYLAENLKHDQRLFWIRSQNNWVTPGE